MPIFIYLLFVFLRKAFFPPVVNFQEFLSTSRIFDIVITEIFKFTKTNFKKYSPSLEANTHPSNLSTRHFSWNWKVSNFVHTWDLVAWLCQERDYSAPETTNCISLTAILSGPSLISRYFKCSLAFRLSDKNLPHTFLINFKHTLKIG